MKQRTANAKDCVQKFCDEFLSLEKNLNDFVELTG